MEKTYTVELTWDEINAIMKAAFTCNVEHPIGFDDSVEVAKKVYEIYRKENGR